MHHIYETKSFILGFQASGEADKRFSLYTENFGLVFATAQGVREIKSKLRYSLQPYSFSVINLVKGRTGWRITNARLEKTFFSRSDRQRTLIVARIFALLKRMLHGEEPNSKLFEVLSEGLQYLSASQNPALPEVELVFVLRILYSLGYVGSSPSWGKSFTTDPWGEELLFAAKSARKSLLSSVNESLKASHL